LLLAGKHFKKVLIIVGVPLELESSIKKEIPGKIKRTFKREHDHTNNYSTFRTQNTKSTAW